MATKPVLKRGAARGAVQMAVLQFGAKLLQNASCLARVHRQGAKPKGVDATVQAWKKRHMSQTRLTMSPNGQHHRSVAMRCHHCAAPA